MERASVVKSLLPCNGTLPLHSLSMATGIAISRLVPGADTEANLLALEAALYAEVRPQSIQHRSLSLSHTCRAPSLALSRPHLPCPRHAARSHQARARQRRHDRGDGVRAASDHRVGALLAVRLHHRAELGRQVHQRGLLPRGYAPLDARVSV
eukprot:506258-Prymnesium_polylepis.2